ncbi:hypothetical protein ACF07L_34135 [Streptomyces anulatus]|uniref:hypothetical protein n=1 Tax=Streptomyces anulatus TaxID=1892 RepID=UPI0036FE2AD3
MTILIDTKNEMKRSVDGLDGRVSELDRELRGALAGEIGELRDNGLADLKASQQETRASAYNAGKRASDAVSAVTELRRDVDRLHGALDGLRRDVGEVLALLHARLPGTADVEGGESTTAEPEPLSGQRHMPEEELAPAGADAPAATEVPADMETAEQSQGQDEELSAVAEEEPEVEASTAQGADSPEKLEEAGRRSLWEAGEPSRDEPVKEPYPFSSAGRIWSIMRAGRVASATLVCHRDTWEFVAAQVGNHSHFRTPAVEERDGGLVGVVLSGRSLVAVLLSLHRVAAARLCADGVDELDSYADWAMASEVYDAVARVLSRTLPLEGDPIVVTIDSRVPAPR